MIAQIETNTFCNHRCWYCQNAHYEPPPKRVMGMDLFNDSVQELSRVYAKRDLNIISFAAYNEPTLDPYFKARLRVLSNHGFAYWFISNGSHMTEDVVDFIIDEKISIYAFLFNIPALNPDEYQAVVQAPVENLNRIQNNLMFLLKRRERIAADIAVVVHGDQSSRHLRNFEHVQAHFKPHGIPVIFGPVMNRAGMLAGVIEPPVDHQTETLDCTADYFSNIYIGAAGNIYLCCHDYYQQYSYGSLTDRPLSDLLSSAERKKALGAFQKAFCRFCSFARPL